MSTETNRRDGADLSRSDLLQRPPHGRLVGATTKPLIVTPTFVSRTDATPEAVRPHDAGSGVNRSGAEVAHPDRHPSGAVECGQWAVRREQHRAAANLDRLLGTDGEDAPAVTSLKGTP